MAGGRPVVGLAPKGGGSTGRAVVGLAPSGRGSSGRAIVGLAGSQAAPKSGGGGFLHDLAKYSGAEVAANLLKDIGTTAIGIGPGIYQGAKALEQGTVAALTGNQKNLDKFNTGLKQTGKGLAQQYKDYYGHDLAHHIYTHPLQPLLDVATVATGGLGAVAKGGKLAADVGLLSKEAKLAKLGERANLVTRSPRNIATGKGPVHTDITSTKPLVKGRELLAPKVTGTEGLGVGPVRVGGEVKRYGKQIQSQATQSAMSRMAPHEVYAKATRRLSHDEWTALHIRAMDIHPADLKILWKGTPLEGVANDAKIEKLALTPSPRMVKAEPQARMLSKQGAQLYRDKKLLREETAAARPELTKTQAEKVLGRPVKTITGEPYYFPHTMEPARNVNPLQSAGGGKGVPRAPGSSKQNLGVLALRGKLHLRTDVLGPEFLRRVKYVKYDEIHNALVRGSIRMTAKQIEELGGHPPKGWDYMRTKPAKFEQTVSAEPNPDQMRIPGTQGATQTKTVTAGGRSIPPTMRGEGTQHIPIDKLIPNAGDLHDSQLAKEGFTTTDPAQAHQSGGAYYLIPKATAKAATGEFTRSSDFTHAFIKRPLAVWRAAVLGLRVGFLTNNLIGNSVMYAVHTGGTGALRDLFGAIHESHGRQVALRILDDPATPPGLRTDLYKEFFPEQIQGTFGRTQSPATSPIHQAGRKSVEAARAVTGAIPRLTSKIAEEYPRRALIRNAIRRSPEFKATYKALPTQTRTFETAARNVLEGRGGAAYQRYVSKQVNQALGDYLNLSPFERNVMRNAVPFYSWYRAITVTTTHLAADTPLRAQALAQIGRIGKKQSDKALGEVPSFLRGSVGLGAGADGTKKVLATQGLNPYATLAQLMHGATTDYTSLGLNPFLEGPMQYLQRARGNVSPLNLLASPLVDLVKSLPPSRLIAPPGPSKLYPTRRGFRAQVPGFLGVPVKEYNPNVAAQQARQGR